METKYFLYARKSSEEEERQLMSIEAQLAELAEYAKRENIKIVETFVESQSAKYPGREVFGRMMQSIVSSRQPVGIIAWHPDRLARNSIDGGQIVYQIDMKKIASLKFPTFWFEPTPQGLFMLQVAFGQSKYFSDNLSENVKRGFRQKIRRGEWLSLAPFGYVNNLKTKNIEPDPIKAKIVGKVFKEYAQGQHTLQSISERLNFWGVVGKNGNPLAKHTVHNMLTNKAYIGILTYKGECYEGGFPPIIPRATFEAVQKIIIQRARPRKSKLKHDFPYTGLLTCGECGGAITAQFAKGNGGLYRYYRCSKKLHTLQKCTQSYLRDDLLAGELGEMLQNVAICDEEAADARKLIGYWEQTAASTSQSFAQELTAKLKATEVKLEKLVDTFLEGNIEKEIYCRKKEELIKTKMELATKKQNLGQKGNNWIEPLKELVELAHSAGKQDPTKDFTAVKSLAEKIGTNRKLVDKKVVWKYRPEWQIIHNYKANPLTVVSVKVPPELQLLGICTEWGGRWDLNP